MGQQIFNVTVNTTGITAPITLSAIGLPPNLTCAFATNPITPVVGVATTIVTTLTWTDSIAVGTYLIEIRGTATGLTVVSTFINITVATGPIVTIIDSLATPGDIGTTTPGQGFFTNLYSYNSEVYVILPNVAALRSVTANQVNNNWFYVEGYYTPGDGGGGEVQWISGSTTPDDGFITFKSSNITTGRFVRPLKDLNIKQAGAKGDFVASDSSYIQLALDTLSNLGGGSIYAPAGQYLISPPLYTPNNIKLWGPGKAALFYNPTTPTTSGIQTSCVFFNGNYGGVEVDLLYPFSFTASAGARTITLVTSAYTPRFTAGSILFLKDSNLYYQDSSYYDSALNTTTSNNRTISLNGYVNRVEAVTINGGNTVITLRYPLEVAFNSGSTVRIDGYFGDTVTITGAITLNSNTITTGSTSGTTPLGASRSVTVGDLITGVGIPLNSHVLTVTPNTSFTIGDKNGNPALATTTATGLTISSSANASDGLYNRKFVTCNSTIAGIAIKSLGPWSATGGTFECLFEDLYIEARQIIYGNAFAYTVFRNVTGLFHQKVIETAYFSHNSNFKNIQVGWSGQYANTSSATVNSDGSPGDPNSPGGPRGSLFQISEAIHHNVYEDFTIDAGTISTGVTSTWYQCLIAGGAHHNVFDRIKIVENGISSDTLVAFNGDSLRNGNGYVLTNYDHTSSFYGITTSGSTFIANILNTTLTALTTGTTQIYGTGIPASTIVGTKYPKTGSPTSITAATTLNSTTMTASGLTSGNIGQLVISASDTVFPSGTVITAVSGTTITLSKAANSTNASLAATVNPTAIVFTATSTVNGTTLTAASSTTNLVVGMTLTITYGDATTQSFQLTKISGYTLTIATATTKAGTGLSVSAAVNYGSMVVSNAATASSTNNLTVIPIIDIAPISNTVRDSSFTCNNIGFKYYLQLSEKDSNGNQCLSNKLIGCDFNGTPSYNGSNTYGAYIQGQYNVLDRCLFMVGDVSLYVNSSNNNISDCTLLAGNITCPSSNESVTSLVFNSNVLKRNSTLLTRGLNSAAYNTRGVINITSTTANAVVVDNGGSSIIRTVPANSFVVGSELAFKIVAQASGNTATNTKNIRLVQYNAGNAETQIVLVTLTDSQVGPIIIQGTMRCFGVGTTITANGGLKFMGTATTNYSTVNFATSIGSLDLTTTTHTLKLEGWVTNAGSGNGVLDLYVFDLTPNALGF